MLSGQLLNRMNVLKLRLVLVLRKSLKDDEMVSSTKQPHPLTGPVACLWSSFPAPCWHKGATKLQISWEEWNIYTIRWSRTCPWNSLGHHDNPGEQTIILEDQSRN